MWGRLKGFWWRLGRGFMGVSFELVVIVAVLSGSGSHKHEGSAIATKN